MKYDKDPLGSRIKENYENITRYYLPRRTYTVVRLDGVCFSQYLKYAERPYDKKVMQAMAAAGVYLCENIQGAQFGFLQSDEINILLQDFGSLGAEPWFGGNLQKIASVSASMATAMFNIHMQEYNTTHSKLALFDSRAFTIAQPMEVYNTFLWRQKDATRNSINMLAQHHFSHHSLQHLSTNQSQEKLFIEKGINWNDCDEAFKRGQFISKGKVMKEVSFTHKKTGVQETKMVERAYWEAEPAFIFSGESKPLLSFIKQIGIIEEKGEVQA